MATRGILYTVFLLPVLFSAIFGTVVMADILQKPDRELNMWRFGDDKHTIPIEIVGLERQYSTSQPISFTVKVLDPTFDCGDLYITIYHEEQVATQQGFFNQCFDQTNPILPVNQNFSENIAVAGIYTISIELVDKSQQNRMMVSAAFTVK